MTETDAQIAREALDHKVPETGGEQWIRGRLKDDIEYSLNGLRRALTGGNLSDIATFLVNGDARRSIQELKLIRDSLEAIMPGMIDARTATQRVPGRRVEPLQADDEADIDFAALRITEEILGATSIAEIPAEVEDSLTNTSLGVQVEVPSDLSEELQDGNEDSDPGTPKQERGRDRLRVMRPKNFDRLELVFEGLADEGSVEEIRALPEEARDRLVRDLETLWHDYSGNRGKNDPRNIHRVAMMLIEGLDLKAILELEGLNEDRFRKGLTAVNRVLHRAPEALVQEMIRRALEYAPQDDEDSGEEEEQKPPLHLVKDIPAQQSEKDAEDEEESGEYNVEEDHQKVVDELAELLEIDPRGESELHSALREWITYRADPSAKMSPNKRVVAERLRDFVTAHQVIIPQLMPESQQRLRELTGIFKNSASKEVKVIDKDPLPRRIWVARSQGQSTKAEDMAPQTYAAIHELYDRIKTSHEPGVAPILGDGRQTAETNVDPRRLFDAFTPKANLTREEIEAFWNRTHRDSEGVYRTFTGSTRTALEKLQTIGNKSGVFGSLEGEERKAIRAFVLSFGGDPADLDAIQQILGSDRDAEEFIRDVVDRIVKADVE